LALTLGVALCDCNVPTAIFRSLMSPETGPGWGVRPLLIVNPRSDVRFVQLVAELTADATIDQSDLQSRLRAEYAEAIVRRRELSSESTEMWYVYRDGRWSPG
jgi:hypothetical protein